MTAPGTGRAELAAVAEDETLPVALRRLLAVTEAAFEQRAQLGRALKTRIVVEQAKGVLAERLGMRPDEAFELLRGTARARQMRVHDLARDVVECPATPVSIVAYAQRVLTEGAGVPSSRQGRET